MESSEGVGPGHVKRAMQRRIAVKWCFFVIVLLAGFTYGRGDVPPERLAARKAFADLEFGIFLHWGLYSTFAQGEQFG